MEQLALKIWVSGRVQGVWYRQSTKEQAITHGVTGWVKNLPDGRVEALLCGSANAVREMEAWMNQGPPLATVAEVTAKQIDIPQAVDSFEVR